MNLSIIGLGKLGLPLAVLQSKTHRVFGVDVSSKAVKMINEGQSPVNEPDLQPLLKKVVEGGQFTAHTDFSVVTGTDMSLIIVPTPSLEDGAFSSKHVLKAVQNIGKAVARQPNRHVVVICSTVMPGECDGIIRATLEKHSGLAVGEDIGLVYSPEFIALGSVIHDMEHPALALIGESDELSGATYAQLVPPKVPIRHMSLTSAEVAKIALNAYITMKISFANTLGELCENIPFADAHGIAEAIGLDPRIGIPYLRPGGPYGGPCFPRDNRAFSVYGDSLSVPTPLAQATVEVNDRQVDRIIRHIRKYPRNTVGILGLTYKVHAPIFEEAFGMKLALELDRRDYEVKVFDPLAMVKPSGLPKRVSWSLDPASCFGNYTVTILANPDPEFVKIFPNVLSADIHVNSVVIDVWGYLPEGPWDATHVVKLGVGE